MRKTLLTLAALLVAGAALQAGNLVPLPIGGGSGLQLKDSTGGQAVLETTDRGIKWLTGTTVSMSTLLSATAQAVTLTGASTNYKGAYYISLYNNGLADILVTPAFSVVPMTSGKPIARVTAGTVWTSGPLSQSHTHVQFVGATATATSGVVTTGVLE